MIIKDRILEVLLKFGSLIGYIIVIVSCIFVYQQASLFYSFFGIEYSAYVTLNSLMVFSFEHPLVLIKFSLGLVIGVGGVYFLRTSRNKHKKLLAASFLLAIVLSFPMLLSMHNTFNKDVVNTEKRLFNPMNVRLKDNEDLSCVKRLGELGNYFSYVDDQLKVYLIKESQISGEFLVFSGHPTFNSSNRVEAYKDWIKLWDSKCHRKSNFNRREYGNAVYDEWLKERKNNETSWFGLNLTKTIPPQVFPRSELHWTDNILNETIE
jgi:hypothetical protein